MTFDIITIFPGFFSSLLEYGVLRRALEGGQAQVRLHDLRDFTDDPHRTVDDRPFGGGPGMVFKPEPIFRAVEALRDQAGGARFPVILLSPQGRLLQQAVAEELARQAAEAEPGARRIVLICGRYEGVDHRVAQSLSTDELSIGDYVLSGGELAAAVVMESCARLLPGVMGNDASGEQESFASAPAAPPRQTEAVAADLGLDTERGTPDAASSWPGLLDFPQYTRPADFRGLQVPAILLSGNHQQIRRWRRRQALEKTWRKRPDLLQNCVLGDEDRRMLNEIKRADLDGEPPIIPSVGVHNAVTTRKD
ncbi:MAG TPA: tRNA (guanosine(37)-N1)-methyltransferase TrmD [Terriglobia bacterium]|nr:tRNA (guanosine(37)-N1)-methyltransferase TrmD [Terriglobia bacterium]